MNEPIVADEKESIKQRIKERLQGIIAISPEYAEVLDTVWGDVRIVLKENKSLKAVLAGATAHSEEMTKQRDAIADEYAEFIRLLEHGDPNKMSENVRSLYYDLNESIAEGHNAAFWESFPYDLADALGREWTFMSADKLYQLISLNLDEEDPEDYGFQAEQVKAFRKALRDLVDSVEED